MRVRHERSGIHLFDRQSGTHILCDELTPSPELWSVAPRTLSIALSNACDLPCYYCYRQRNTESLTLAFVQQVAKAVDRLETLEVTLGGGEPLLVPYLALLCEWIWKETSLGVSLTTHGHHLTADLLWKLTGHLSSIRFSIDGVEPYYSRIRASPLSRLVEIIRRTADAMPIGINVVVSPGHVGELRRVIELAERLGAFDVLIIPQHDCGRFILSAEEWHQLDLVIHDYDGRVRLAVTEGAARYLQASILPTECAEEFCFAHVSADRRLDTTSYGRGGMRIEDGGLIRDYLLQLRRHERGDLDEGLDRVCG